MVVDIQNESLAGSVGAVGASAELIADAAGREAVRVALAGHVATDRDLVVVFTSCDYDIDLLYAAAAAEAAPAKVVGCTSTGGFTHETPVPHGCVAALLEADGRSFGVCHVEREPGDIAGSTRRAAEIARANAGDEYPHSVLMLLTDGLTPDQREVARGAYEATGALISFVGGAAADDLKWQHTCTFGDGRVLDNGILAVWINSELPMAVSVGHGWSPTGRPMLVTRGEGTIVRELDGTPALDAYLAENDHGVKANDPEFFLHVLDHPVGLPNGRGQYDVRQLHAYLPEGGGLNFNTGISEQSILQVMTSDSESLLEGAWLAAREAGAQLGRQARLALVFSCGSRVPLLGERVGEEATAIATELGTTAVCGFFTYGEFARVNGSTGVHNSSVAILAL
jgi:hypothetical protein